MNLALFKISPAVLCGIFLILSLFFMAFTNAQSTFTESAAAYGLNLAGNKDGGHAWADYDDDGDIDVLVLRNSNSQRNYLMRNNGNGTFTNVQSTLVPGMLNTRAERQAAWGDLNGDGLPDFLMTSHGTSSSTVAMQIFIQNANGTFGDGIGGTAPISIGENNSATITINPLNVEGAGFFDFEGDGDLDIFFDSHAFGIELLRNNYIDHTTHTIVNPPPTSFFTHITPGNGGGVVEYGLNQFATDGDFGSAADVNDDGWVDIFMRKRDENDFFLNQGGVFANGSDLAQADNGNKGGNGLWDLDNDGDLDAVWTENGLNQIFRNDGPGVWTPLGAATFPGLPQPTNVDRGSSSNDIDALAGGDIDNDGDIDILFVGDSRSYLFINQLNSPTPAPGVVGSGTAMTFNLDSEPFNSGANGEGTTMIDIDDDGDLDIYMNISGQNRLYINNLPAANLGNHLIIDVTEDRDASGSTGGLPERIAIGTNILIKDCDGNIISGLRQVNGVFGHGTQSPEKVHVGLPLGENETYTIEIRYPNFYDPVDGFKRLIGTIIATPSAIPGTNHYNINSSQAELSENINAPNAIDDLEIVTTGTSVSVQISLFDNDFDADGHDFFIESIVQPPIGSVVIDDADAGLVTYTYSAGTLFQGTTFDYTISDSPVGLCPALGKFDTATVTISEPCADPSGIDTDGDGINDLCDLDDDNDGILDCDESTENLGFAYFAWNFNFPSGTRSVDVYSGSEITDWVLNSTGDMTVSGITASTPGSSFHITDIPSSNLGQAIANDDYFQATFTTSTELANPELTNMRWSYWDVANMRDSYYMSLAISDDGFATSTLMSTDVFITAKPSGSFDMMDDSSYKLKPNTSYTVRLYVYGQIDDTTYDHSIFDDFRIIIDACRAMDSDSDGSFNHLETDSDDDGCNDVLEAGFTDNNFDGILGPSPVLVDVNGLVTSGLDGYSGTSPTVTNPSLQNGCADNDNDGISDFNDIDDDNDGILDSDECSPSSEAFLAPQYITSTSGSQSITAGSSSTEVTLSSPTNTHTSRTTFNGYSGYMLSSGNTDEEITLSFADPVTEFNIITYYHTADTRIERLSIYLNGNRITINPSNFNITNGNPYIDSSGVYIYGTDIGQGNFEYTILYTAGIKSVRLFQEVLAGTPQGSIYEFSASGQLLLTCDDDGDGVPNTFDLDSDNDGIYDVIEAGGTDLDGDGIIGIGNITDTNFNGWSDLTDNTNGGTNLPDIDSDLDGNFNRLESDSDNDGCNDALEAGFTDGNNDGYLGPNPVIVDLNGLVTSGSDGYTTPEDADTNTIFDFQEVGIAPSISTQPIDLTLCPGCSGSIVVNASNTDTYQWQFFNGSIWVDLTNSGNYSGVDTNTLVLTNVTPAENGNQYRVVVSSSTFVCIEPISNAAILTVNVPTVITNRRITYRVKKN